MSGGTFVALGTNLPYAGLAGPDLLREAIVRLRSIGLMPRAASSIWKTAPWPPADQAPFFNAVIELGCTGHTPQSLFDQLSVIERAFGRERRERFAARTLDLDILDINGMAGTFGDISLPHKRLHERAFVLAPLAELGWRHPVLRKTAAELLVALPPGQHIARTSEPLVL